MTASAVQPLSSRAPELRLALASQFARANRLDGAWWPYSVDLTMELAPLLDAVAGRVGRIRGVLLNRSEWAPTPLDWIPSGNRRTRISWYGSQDPDVAILIGDKDKRVKLLVIPPSTATAEALAAMTLASRCGNTLSGSDTLLAVRV
jgi:hypothetical protein